MKVQCFLELNGGGAGDHGGLSCSPLRWTCAGASVRIKWGVEGELALKKVS